jgi:transcription-repair coupling factor (superfamily II helicase)
MSKTLVRSLFSKSDALKKLNSQLLSESRDNCVVSGLIGSAVSLIIAETFKTSDLPFLLILNDKEEAAYHLNDLENLLGDDNVLFYPGSYRRPYQIDETDNANVLLRSEVLNRITSRKKPSLIVTYHVALFEKVLTKK